MNDAIFSKVVAIRLAGGAFNLPFTGAAQAQARAASADAARNDALAGSRACLGAPPLLIRIVLFIIAVITHAPRKYIISNFVSHITVYK